jgi:hypothetical protein
VEDDWHRLIGIGEPRWGFHAGWLGLGLPLSLVIIRLKVDHRARTGLRNAGAGVPGLTFACKNASCGLTERDKETSVMDAATEHDWAKENLLIEGLQDSLHFSEVHQQFRSRGNAQRPPNEVQQLTLSMIRELVGEGLFVLGTIEGPKRSPYFVPWDLPLDEAMAKIEDAYVNHFDDRWGWVTVCWLDLTDRGKELALELYHADDPDP